MLYSYILKDQPLSERIILKSVKRHHKRKTSSTRDGNYLSPNHVPFPIPPFTCCHVVDNIYKYLVIALNFKFILNAYLPHGNRWLVGQGRGHDLKIGDFHPCMRSYVQNRKPLRRPNGHCIYFLSHLPPSTLYLFCSQFIAFHPQF